VKMSICETKLATCKYSLRRREYGQMKRASDKIR